MAVQISHSHKCIFVHVPRTAGTSIESLPIFSEEAKRIGKKVGGHTSASRYQLMYPNEFEQYFKFTFVRNPWDRLVSSFFFYKRNGDNLGDKLLIEMYSINYNTFKDFCSDFINEDNVQKVLHLKPQHTFICNDKNRILVNFVGKFENLVNDFKFVCGKIGYDYQLYHKSKTDHKHYTQYYTKETKEIVKEVYQKDIDLFNYNFE